MKKKGLLLLILTAFLLIFPACTKQSSEPPVFTGEKETAVSSVTKETTKEVEGSQEDLEKIVESEAVNKGQKDSQQTKKTEKKETFSLLVSQNYGAVALAKEDVLLKPKMSVLDGLVSVYPDEVETAYGGSYVRGISSLRSKTGGLGKPNQDWFFFVNGIFADRGALDYLPQPGEKVWWDYHPWQMFQGTTAVIGCYPEPFLHGYRGKIKTTAILYCPEEKEFALQLAETLKTAGVQEVTPAEITNEALTKRAGPTLVIGEWGKLRENAYLAEWNQAYAKNGTFIHFTENSLELLDYTGEKAHELTKGAGVITAFGETAGDDSPLWIVSGIDPEGLSNAVRLLVEQPTQISGFFGAAVLSAEVIRLPLMP